MQALCLSSNALSASKALVLQLIAVPEGVLQAIPKHGVLIMQSRGLRAKVLPAAGAYPIIQICLDSQHAALAGDAAASAGNGTPAGHAASNVCSQAISHLQDWVLSAQGRHLVHSGLLLNNQWCCRL